MNINTIFKEVKGRSIDLCGVNYANAYQQKDIKTATAIMYLLQQQGLEVAQGYAFFYDQNNGLCSIDIVEDIFVEQNQNEKIELSEELDNYIEDILQASVGTKISNTLVSAAKVHFYKTVMAPEKPSEQDFYNLFSDEQQRSGYKVGKRFWRAFGEIREERNNQSQPE